MKHKSIILISVFLAVISIFTYFLIPTKKTNTKEVFQIGKNIYRYMEAVEACEKIGADLATKKDLDKAYKAGAEWNNLGWIRGLEAYFPLQKTSKIGTKGLNGGKMASQLKLGATCVGYKPSNTTSILPWSKNKWSMFS